MRTFVAINLGADVRAAAFAAAAPLREATGRAVSWTAPDALHVTLKFLGERAESFVAALVDRVAPLVAREQPFDLAISGFGAFPSLRNPRVLWIGASANPTLSRLYHVVDDACAALGVAREQRAFHPHVTLGRSRREQRVDGATLVRVAAAVDFSESQRVCSVDVMESVLGRGGARYRVVDAMKLDPGSEEP